MTTPLSADEIVAGRDNDRIGHDVGDLPALQGPANDAAGEQV